MILFLLVNWLLFPIVCLYFLFFAFFSAVQSGIHGAPHQIVPQRAEVVFPFELANVVALPYLALDWEKK